MARPSGHVDAGGERRAREQALRETESTWAALASDARNGDPEAARRLFDAIVPAVRRVCRGVLGDRHFDLEDTVQECLLDVLRALPGFRSEGHLVHYVTKISIRRAIRSRRKGARRERSLEGLEDFHGGGALEPAGRSLAEQSRMVSEVIARVSAVQAETLVLRMVLGHTVEEVASIMSVPFDTVRMRLRLAKKALRSLNDEHERKR